jgi:hypothetical protein
MQFERAPGRSLARVTPWVLVLMPASASVGAAVTGLCDYPGDPLFGAARINAHPDWSISRAAAAE